MFSDHTSEATEFRSSWRQTRSVKEGGCQTERQETRDATAQSTIYDEAGTQTEERDAVRFKQERNAESPATKWPSTDNVFLWVVELQKKSLHQ